MADVPRIQLVGRNLPVRILWSSKDISEQLKEWSMLRGASDPAGLVWSLEVYTSRKFPRLRGQVLPYLELYYRFINIPRIV